MKTDHIGPMPNTSAFEHQRLKSDDGELVDVVRSAASVGHRDTIIFLSGDGESFFHTEITSVALRNDSNGHSQRSALVAELLSADPSINRSSHEVAQLLANLLEHDHAYRHIAGDVRMLLALADGLESRLDVTQVPVSERAKALMQRVEIERAVRHSVLAEGTYSATEVGDLLGSTSKNPRDKASRLRQAGELLGVEVAGSVLYPAFQFDATRASLRPGVAPTNRELNAKDDSWAVASWWLSPHARLDQGVRPADLALAGDEASLSQLVAAIHAD